MTKRWNEKLTHALKSNHVATQDTSFLLYDVNFLEDIFKNLKNEWPEKTLHALAIKSCPLINILKIQKEFELGAEAASLEEIWIALEAGIKEEDIIFDSPAKTTEEIEFCLNNNIYFNMDSFEEFERVKIIAGERDYKCGMRLNPEIGKGTISHTSVGNKGSKFGVPIIGNEEKIKTLFEENPNLVGVHVHVGSQGMSLDHLIKAISQVYHFSKELNDLSVFDLGGGLPVSYYKDQTAPSLSEYRQTLERDIPELFDSKLKLVSEFGRSVFANSAVAVSQIEYIKNKNEIVVHLGADMFLRWVYRKEDWHHDVSAFSKDKDFEKRPKEEYQINGPLCFGGDILASELSLPKLTEEDYVIFHDCGAYTLSMWSRHCNRSMPKVLGVKNNEIFVLKSRQSKENILSLWK
ncbi:hypothetical protein N9N67_04110 [Bacteriovoracaceae bacterium]|nr:hypothetical protein [Bacteriovoracaceae bacterium]